MLARVAREAAERFGDATAYVSSSGWALSYRDVDRLSDEAAVGLAQHGLGRGDLLALALPSIPEYMVLYLAAAKLGAVTAGVNARLGPDERAAVLAVAKPSLVAATADLAPDDTAAGEVVEIEPAAGVDGLLADLRVEGERPGELPVDPDRPVAVVFTSGTTGVPKGVVFCNRQLETITTIDTGNQWGGGGATYAGTSFAHLGPMTKLPGSLYRGGTTYLVDRWRAADALRMIEEHRMVSIGGIPTQLALMLQEPDFERYDLASLQAIVIGGGPATPALVREARARFNAALAVRYSCTEAGIGCGTAFDAPPEDAEETVGKPQPGVELRIAGPDGAPVPDGEPGEVCLRSGAVMAGYYRDPEATAAAFTADGFVRTGDVGHVDEQGRLRLVGRSKEMYVRGGYNVYPMEVESVLAAHPSVADLAGAPRPDSVMGEIGVAVVVPRDPSRPPTLDDLRSFAADRLARHKLPEALALAEALPLTPMEKLDRGALARLVTPPDEESK